MADLILAPQQAAVSISRFACCSPEVSLHRENREEIVSGKLGTSSPRPNLGRHKRQCSVCSHPKCAEIEAEFVAWRSPAAIAGEYGLVDRANIYRHAHALGLFVKRQQNVRAALERIIEKAGEAEVTATAVVAAVQAYSKINAAGQWVDRSEHVNLNELFERMTQQELESCARDGSLPRWFTGAMGATATHSREGERSG